MRATARPLTRPWCLDEIVGLLATSSTGTRPARRAVGPRLKKLSRVATASTTKLLCSMEVDDQFSEPDDDLDAAGSDLVFECRTDAGRRLTNMLSSICLSSRQRDSSSTLAWVEVTDHNMTFTVGVAKSLQAVAYVKRQGIFHKWWLAPEHRGDHPTDGKLEFGINLATLLECLRIFGGTAVGGGGTGFECKAQLHINYRASTACLNLCLVEG